MRILLQNSVFFPNMVGGAEHSTLLLARTLSALGHQVDIVCTNGRRADGPNLTRSIEGVDGTVHEGPSAGLLDLYEREAQNASLLLKALHHWNAVRSTRWERWLHEHVRTQRYDVLHSNNLAGMGDAPWRVAAAVGVPVVHTLRDYALLCPRTTLWRSRGELCENAPIPCRFLRRQKLSIANTVRCWVAATEHVLETHRSLGSLGPGRQRVIPNAYTGELVSDHEAPAADPLRILYMGQLEEHKGVPLLFQALESLWAGGSQLQATIAGAGSLSQEAERFAGVHAERCQFVGRIAGEEKQRALRESSVVLFPSIWREPFGLGVIEGFAYGRPVIACEGSGGPEEMIRDGVDGRIVPPTSAGIAAAIREYVDRPGRLQMHAEASWKRREEFGAETMARRYVAAYEGASADLS